MKHPPVKRLLAQATNLVVGHPCPFRCGHRAHGWCSLLAHTALDHAGDPL